MMPHIRPSSYKFRLTEAFMNHIIAHGAVVSLGDVSIVDMINSDQQGIDYVLDKIASIKKQDPNIFPTFGLVGAITAHTQRDVLNIISTYQPLVAADFLDGNNIPIVPVGDVATAANTWWQYEHAQKSISAVIKRLQNPGPGPFSSSINELPSGAFICILQVSYSNVVFPFRIVKE